MELYPIYAAGIKAYCSDLIIDPNEMDTVYFLSICGYQTTVKGIIANLLENYYINIRVNDIDYSLYRSNRGYKVKSKKLPSGLIHSLLFPEMALSKNNDQKESRFIIFGEDKERLLTLFFRHLDEMTEMPLHPSWDAWLWEVFKEQHDWFMELYTAVGNLKGYLFEFDADKLCDLISGTIKEGDPEIIECMQWKGGD